MAVLVIICSLLLIQTAVSQLPNFSRYRVTLTLNGTKTDHYAYDSPLGKMSHMSFSNSTDERYGGTQYIYMGPTNTTYLFNFMTYPSVCTARKGGPPSNMNYWLDTINRFGGENKTCTEILFDRDCRGACLTWYIEYNPAGSQVIVHERLYIRKSDVTPIKLVRRFYQRSTEQFLSTDVIGFVHWNPFSITYDQFDYPMNIENCTSVLH